MVSTLLTTVTGGQRGPMEKGRRHKAGRPSFLDAGCTPLVRLRTPEEGAPDRRVDYW